MYLQATAEGSSGVSLKLAQKIVWKVSISTDGSAIRKQISPVKS